MKQDQLQKLLAILDSEKTVDFSQVTDLVSVNLSEKTKRQFVDIINCLREKQIGKVFNPQKNIINLFFNNIKATLAFNYDEFNKFTRLEILPIVDNCDNLVELYDCLLKLDAKTYIYSSCEQVKTNFYESLFAVSSLIKIFVGVIILEACENGIISLDDTYRIDSSDLSYLSSGINSEKIGQAISIRELLSYLFLASDNTAMDILLKIMPDDDFYEIGQKISPKFDLKIPPTKDILRNAWCDPDLSEEHWRKHAVTKVKWLEGEDYFVNPNILNIFIERLMSYNWTPYVEVSSMIYKGGSAPGVLSGVWANSHTNNYLVFILNRDRPFNLLEEMYCYKCIFNYLEKNI